MAVRAIVEWARAIPGCLGVAVYAGDAPLFSENLEPVYASALRSMLSTSPGTVRASAAVRGVTLIAFPEDGLTVLLKVAGRFPALPGLHIAEPEFVGPSPAPVLSLREDARREAEAALRQFGLL